MVASGSTFTWMIAGLPALVYGPESDDVHGFDERVNMESIRKITQSTALFIAGLGAALFYGANGWLAGREYYEQVALRRLDPADVKARRKANGGVLWLTGIVLVFLGTIPILNLIVPVLGVAAMVHVAQSLKPPSQPGRPL